MNADASAEYEHWNATFAGEEYFYGHEPGPVARRAMRYQRAGQIAGGHALDVGCGEGQDALFLARSDYQTTGLELTKNGVAKTRQLLRDFDAEILQRDLQRDDWARDLGNFDLVLAINCLQFLGTSAPKALRETLELVAPNGVVGLSVFAREENDDLDEELWLPTRDEVLAFLPDETWQPLEVAQLWQWGMPTAGESARARMFVTVVARRLN